MTTIDITENDNRVHVATPYNPDFAPRAKEIGGRWNPDTKTWNFDPRDRDRVETILSDLFGYIAHTSGEKVTVRIKAQDHVGTSKRDGWDKVTFAGRIVAQRRSRDAVVDLGSGVVIVDGAFDRSAGSMQYPAITEGRTNVVLEIRDLPIEALENARDYELVDGDPHAALRAEREKLIARIAEIDALLG